MPTQQDKMDDIYAARHDMPAIAAKLRISKAVSPYVPKSADPVVEVNNSGRVFCETEKR